MLLAQTELTKWDKGKSKRSLMFNACISTTVEINGAQCSVSRIFSLQSSSLIAAALPCL
jgi:hypothetical protein